MKVPYPDMMDYFLHQEAIYREGDQIHVLSDSGNISKFLVGSQYHPMLNDYLLEQDALNEHQIATPMTDGWL